jgi:hypothetical protein
MNNHAEKAKIRAIFQISNPHIHNMLVANKKLRHKVYWVYGAGLVNLALILLRKTPVNITTTG